MRRPARAFLCVGSILLALSFVSWSKEQSKPGERIKVCVAGISNRTATSLFEERMAARLTKSLEQNKLAALAMDSSTTNDHELHPTVENGQEMKRQECDYVLLTQVRESREQYDWAQDATDHDRRERAEHGCERSDGRAVGAGLS
jgi:hypothetical protein